VKDFVVEDMEEFLDLSERVASPFKFVEVTVEEGAMRIRASIWMRIAFVSYEQEIEGETLEGVQDQLRNRGFMKALIKETPVVVKP